MDLASFLLLRPFTQESGSFRSRKAPVEPDASSPPMDDRNNAETARVHRTNVRFSASDFGRGSFEGTI